MTFQTLHARGVKHTDRSRTRPGLLQRGADERRGIEMCDPGRSFLPAEGTMGPLADIAFMLRGEIRALYERTSLKCIF